MYDTKKVNNLKINNAYEYIISLLIHKMRLINLQKNLFLLN